MINTWFSLYFDSKLKTTSRVAFHSITMSIFLPGEAFRAGIWEDTLGDQGNAGQIISLGCLGKVLVSPQRSWWKWSGRGTSGSVGSGDFN